MQNPTMAPAWALALSASFGSVEAWRADFCALAAANAGRAGSVVLVFRPDDGTLANRFVAAGERTTDAVPLLGFDASGDADAFLDRTDWAPVYESYQAAVDDASESLGCNADEIGDAPLVDVRRAGAFKRANTIIEGAQWRDPQQVGEWAGEFKPGQRVNVYCVYGHEVGRTTALRLKAAGVDARFVRGGIDEWEKAGRPVKPR